MGDQRLGDDVLAHLRSVVATRAASPEAHAVQKLEPILEGPATEAAIPAMSRIDGRFTIEKRLGLGGMGAVYLAYDHLTSTRVALKVVHAGHSTFDVRFEREALALESVAHPGVVRHLTHGVTREGTWYLATEVLAGHTLRDRLQNGVLDVTTTVDIARDIAAALAAIHSRGLVHRDLTPNNILLCTDGSLRLLDFGLTHLAGASHSLTGQGGVVGTFGYMSPEQATGEPDVDARADVFALGCVLMQCLTGRPPFGVGVAQMLAQLISKADPIRGLPPDTPPDLAALLASMLARERTGRPANGGELLVRLRRLEASRVHSFGELEIATLPDAAAPSTAFAWRSGGARHVTIVTKLTFDLVSGVAQLSAVQDEIVTREEHLGGDPTKSLRQPSDLAPRKDRSDVVVVGHAFTDGSPATAIHARLVLAGIDKSVVVSGPSGGGRNPIAISKGSLAYEHAPRGTEHANPVGVDVDTRDPAGGTVAPSVRAPAGAGGLEPVGFGPIAGGWPERRATLSVDADAWLHGRAGVAWPGESFEFFNCAPMGQRRDPRIAADETLRLEGLHPNHAVLMTKLPGLVPVVQARLGNATSSGETLRVEMSADTLWIDTDRAIATVTFRGVVTVPPEARALSFAVALAEESAASRAVTGLAPAAAHELKTDDVVELMGATLAVTPAIPRTSASSAPRSVVTSSAPMGGAPESVRTATPRTLSPDGAWERASHANLEVLWSESGVVARIRESADLCDLVPLTGVETATRRALHRVLRRGSIYDLDELAPLLLGSLHAEGATPPLCLVQGDLALAFDESARLSALVSVGLRAATAHPGLEETIHRARSLLEIEGAAVEAVRAATADLLTELAAAKVEARVTRTLLEKRAYQVLAVLGRRSVRGLLTLRQDRPSVPTYLCESAISSLPLFSSYPVRALVEIRTRQDEAEASPISLRVLALARPISGLEA